MAPAYALKLDFWVYRTNIGAQKFDGSTLETFGIVLVDFQVENKLWVKFDLVRFWLIVFSSLFF